MDATWQPTFQTTIDAYYEGRLAEGMAACERLLALDDVPANIEVQARRNRVFYARQLSDLAPSTTARPIEFPVPSGWSRFNPSIAEVPGGDGYRMVVRSANFMVSRKGEYSTTDGDVVRTRNYLVNLDPDLVPVEIEPIDDSRFRREPPPFPVAGFEDCRLVHYKGAWWVSATVRDHNPLGMAQIALLRLEGAEAVEEHLLSDGVERHEKNWMPVVGSGALRFVYTCGPTVIVRYDDETNTVAAETTRPAPHGARHFRGGSQVIPVDGGHLCLIHESTIFDDGGRVYTHRWVWFDSSWRLAKLSAPFLLHVQERGIEFAGGLAWRGDDLVISYGVWDREAWQATVPIAEVLPLLAPPLDPDEVEEEMRAAAATVPAPDFPSVVPEPEPAAPESILDAEYVPIPDDAPSAAGFTPFPVTPVTLASTTLTGNNRDIIGDALRSVVDWVDWVIVIDTGVSDDTLEVAKKIAGDKLIVREFPWQNDFAAARNFALQAAAETGAAWAITLDTDERLDPGDVDIRAALAQTEGDALHVKQASGTYGKERFFRLPARGHYVGPTHEAFIKQSGGTETLEGVLFEELGKSHEQYRQKAERDVAILTRHTAEHPDDPRWFYYLGDSLAGLGRHEEAIAAFRACSRLNGWDEESAWAMYRAGESLLKLDRPVEAVEACAIGMARHAGLAELPWLAGYAAWQAGRPAQAAHWARMSILLGHFMGNGASVPRIGFRHPPALWEGPFDVLRFALRALGDDQGADEAERVFEQAKAARESS